MSENDTNTEVIEEAHEDTSNDVRANLKDRFLLPFLIPVIVAAIVALMGISFSRVFLAGASKGEATGGESIAEHASKASAPVMWATIVTLVVLLGAAGISSMKGMRATSFRLVVAGAIVLIIMTGAILFGAGEKHEEALQYGQPTPEQEATADPNNTIEVDALGTLAFQANAFTAAPGVVDIKYIGKGGSHQLKIKDSRLNWFDLVVSAGTEDEGKVNLEAGDYVIYCPIAGHTNMVATLTVK